MKHKNIGFVIALFMSIFIVQGSLATEDVPAKPEPASAEIISQVDQLFRVHAKVNDFQLVDDTLVATVVIEDVPDDALVEKIELKLTSDQEWDANLAVDIYAPAAGALNISAFEKRDQEQVTAKQKVEESAGQTQFIYTAQETYAGLEKESVQGQWKISIANGAQSLPSAELSGTLVVYYSSDIPLPEVRSGAAGAQPAFQRIREGDFVSEIATDDSPNKPDAPDVETSWEVIAYEGFEYVFPDGDWYVIDAENDENEYLWDDDDYKPYTDYWSGWPANGGANGLDPELYYYPNNMRSWMIYGPFDLSSSTEADTFFQMWREIEENFDYLFFGVSLDGFNYSGYAWDGYTDWEFFDIYYNDYDGITVRFG